MRGEFAADVGVAEEVGECAADCPVHVAETVEPVLVVGEETALVAEDGGLVDEHGGGDVGGVGEFVEIALFSEDGSDELAVVFEEEVVGGGSARLEDELSSLIAVLCHC